MTGMLSSKKNSSGTEHLSPSDAAMRCEGAGQDEIFKGGVQQCTVRSAVAFKKWLLFGIWVLFFFNFWHLCFNLTMNLLGLTIALLGFTGIYWDLLPVTWAGPGAGHHFGHAACLAQWIQTCESRNQD